MFILSLCFLAVIYKGEASVATFIKPCALDDNPCILQTAQAAVPIVAPGIPELNIKPLDPMFFETVKSEESTLQLTFKNTTVTGMKNCAIDAIKNSFSSISKGKQVPVIRCSVVLDGWYKLGGQLLILPVQGEGKYNIKITDIIIKASTDLEAIDGADGKPHWHINKWKHSFQVKTGTVFYFENLFNGNKLLAQPVLQFANANWRDVMNEVAPPIVRAIVSRVIDAVEALYVAVPIDELTL